MRRNLWRGSLILVLIMLGTSCRRSVSLAERLRNDRRGVWVQASGGYTVWTARHYAVVTANGDSTASNIYCGVSQVRYTDRGIARRQIFRMRQRGAGPVQLRADDALFRMGPDSTVVEDSLRIDAAFFEPGRCTVHEGVIYDAVTEVTDRYIVLSTCNGDREKLFRNGRAVYLPAAGGAFWEYRIEELP